jgi:hypothetical protein
MQVHYQVLHLLKQAPIADIAAEILEQLLVALNTPQQLQEVRSKLVMPLIP